MATKNKTQEIMVTDNLMERIQQLPEVVADTPEEIQARILERIFNTTSLEEMLAPQGTLSAEDVAGKSIQFMDVHFNESGIAGQNGFYAVADAIVDGKSVAISCGSRTVMAMLLQAKTQGWLPFHAEIVKSPTPTASGFFPLWLAPVAAPASPKPAPEPEEAF